MTFNLIHEKWIWVQRQDGTRSMIAPWQITDEIGSNPIVSLDEPRPDFNGSMIQFLIGLVQTTISPKSDRDWRKRFTSPPTPEELLKTFENVSQVFELDGDNGRFMQDHEHFEDVAKSKDIIDISQLLMEMPGDTTIIKNTDHFIKRNVVKQMCLPCCATALFSLQTNAPEGGRGHLTSLRGGGPLTSIVVGDNLWQTIWLNIITEINFNNLGDVQKKDLADIFPWMGPTRTAGKDRLKTSSMDANPKQMYWGMPRRIRINFDNIEEGNCDVCGCRHDRLVKYHTRKTYGTDYNSTWCHVLTPYYEDKNELRPKHIEKGGIYYKHWLGLVQNDLNNGQIISKSYEIFIKKQKDIEKEYDILKNPTRLWTFGYDFDKNKVRCWYESTFPLYNISEDVKSSYESSVFQLIKVAEIIDKNTINCIKQVLFNENKNETKIKKKLNVDLSIISSRFWHDSESEFYFTLNKLYSVLECGSDALDLKLNWIKTLSKKSEILFEEYSQSNQLTVVDPERVATAYKNLRWYNSENNEIFRNLLDLPEKKKT